MHVADSAVRREQSIDVIACSASWQASYVETSIWAIEIRSSHWKHARFIYHLDHCIWVEPAASFAAAFAATTTTATIATAPAAAFVGGSTPSAATLPSFVCESDHEGGWKTVGLHTV
jgi:hypothetical protein